MKRIVDLSEPIRSGIHGVSITQKKRIEHDGWNTSNLELYSHAATHIDAPWHFVPDGVTIDALDLAKCIGPAWLIDCTPVAARDLIEIDHLGEYVPRIRPGDRVLLRTDWSKMEDRSAYRTDLPRISIALARWLADQQISLLGIEQPSVADMGDPDELISVHQTLLGAGIVIVESLCNLDALTADQVQLIALPLKIDGGDGAPARVVAIEEV